MFTKYIENYLKRNNFPKIDLKAVLFDMDGVLFDSMPNHARSWCRTMEHYGLEFSTEKAYMNEGQRGADTINNIFVEKYGRDATDDEIDDIYDTKSRFFGESTDPTIIPFADKIMEKIDDLGIEIYVVTGSAQPMLLNQLTTNFHLVNSDKIVSALNFSIGKPDPAPYLKALEMAGLNPNQAVVIENAPLGVKSSSAAQIFTIGVNTGPLSNQILLNYGADIVLDSMENLYTNWELFLQNIEY